MIPYGVTIIRLGMASVLLWFGLQQLLDGAVWTSYVPESFIMMTGILATTIVVANGIIEVAFGLLLFLGLFTRVAALLMALHLAGIAISLGYNAVAIRDLGLGAALFGLVFTGAGAFGLDKAKV